MYYKNAEKNTQNSILGEGTYSYVKTEGDKAVKVISHKYFESAVREIGLINACNHPNIIKITDIEFDQTETLIYMKKYQCDLRAYMDKLKLLPVDIVYGITKQIISGIAHVHSRGIIHGDVKPQNILLEYSSGSDIPGAIICDFGIAVINEEKYHTSRVQTCTYRAPEVDYNRSRVQYSFRIDLWSIGCILLEMASGKPTNIYDAGVEDSTIYACRLFGLYESGTRKERLKLLRAVNIKHIRNCIYNRMCNMPQRYKMLFDSGFINLISLCLHPNHNKRVDAISILSIANNISYINSPPVSYTASYINSAKIHIDDMACIRNIPDEIISKCNISCLNLSETVYRKFMYNEKDNRDIYQYAALYIASCIFSGSLYVRYKIEEKITRRILLGGAAAIVLSLSGRIL